MALSKSRNPVREGRYTLQLPQRWEYKVNWINHQAVQPTSSGTNQWLSSSLGTFETNSASVANPQVHNQPFGYIYSFTSYKYAKNAGEPLLVRPRVLGNWSSDILEKKEPRKYAVEFDGLTKNIDSYEIELPEGYTSGRPAASGGCGLQFWELPARPKPKETY